MQGRRLETSLYGFLLCWGFGMNIKGVMFSSSKCDETVFKEAIRETQAYIKHIYK